MDHDYHSATVHNGKLVSSRKGLLTSKSNHQGVRFVNSFASPSSEPDSLGPSKNPNASPAEPQSRPPHKLGRIEPENDENAPLGTDIEDERTATEADRPALTYTSPPSTDSSSGAGLSPALFEQTINMKRQTAHPTNPINTSGESSRGHGDASNMASPPPSATTANPPHSLNIPYLRPPVPKGTLPPNDDSPDPHSSSASDDTSQLAQRIVQQYLHNVPQRSYTYEAIALVASLANGGGSVPPSELGPSIARVCAHMNRELLASDEDGRKSELAVVESIAAMAIDAVYNGRQDHWHVLMRGLRDIVDRGGGMKAEWGDTLNRIRKADIKGAAYSGSPPYLEFNKVFHSISDSLPPHRRAELAIRTEQLLQPCNVDQANIDSLQALAFFTQTVVLARHASSPRAVVLDSRAFAEDCLHVENQLVGRPGPLRAEVGESTVPVLEQDLASMTEAGPGDGNPLNALVRVAGILYIEDLLPDSRSTDLYTILLTVLIHQTRTILDGLMQGAELTLSSPNDARPVLLWACLVGYAITNFTNAERGTRLDSTVFEDCASVVLSGSSSDDDEADEDLMLCEMLPLGELRSVSCDEGMLLRQLIAGHEARHGRRLSAVSSLGG